MFAEDSPAPQPKATQTTQAKKPSLSSECVCHAFHCCMHSHHSHYCGIMRDVVLLCLSAASSPRLPLPLPPSGASDVSLSVCLDLVCTTHTDTHMDCVAEAEAAVVDARVGASEARVSHHVCMHDVTIR